MGGPGSHRIAQAGEVGSPPLRQGIRSQGYCNRLKSDLLRYSDKARGLTDAQKIEAHACYERLAAYPNASLSQAVDLLVARLDRATNSFPVRELAGRVVVDKKKQEGRGSGKRLLREIEERLGRFSRVFGDRMVSDIETAEVRAWLMDLTTIIQTSRGKEETDQPVEQSTRQAYKRTLSLCFGWAKSQGAVTANPVVDVKLAQVEKERVFVFTPEQTAILLQKADENLRPYMALCAFAGLRPEQAQGLWWKDIHLEHGTHGEIQVEKDKANGGRVVPIQPNLRAWLLAVPEAKREGTVYFSMFLVVVAQSAATARSFAQKNRESLNENRDLLALGAANVLAGVSGTFVVNGSPTKTAVVVSAGGRTQTSQVTTGVVTLAVLLVATTLIERLPNAALAAIVFLIGVRLIDVTSLRQIAGFRKATFAVAMAALLGVVFLGVERGIFVAIGLSVLDHLRQEYHPKDVVLIRAGEHWKAHPANPGVQTAPGLIVYRFESALFFANADYFAARLHDLIGKAPQPVRHLVLDLVSMDDIDYTGGLTLLSTLQELHGRGVTIGLAQTEDVRDELERLGILKLVRPEHVFDSVSAALDASVPGREQGRNSSGEASLG